MSKATAFFTGLMVGGAAAAIAVLCTAPSSGKDFRKKVKQKSNLAKQSLGDLKDQSLLLKDQVIQAASESKIVFNDLKEDMQHAFSTWQQEIKPNKANIEQELKDIQTSLQQLQNAVPPKE
ncbi:YtxH domain-containing protein [Ectobacillus antri]|uniref:YtxH domain-containing protein n=1 Tax=Ectobacillus antri TaxID=2486280 RepID=A0ABT6H3C8_9BACI|nr:YtxH domain-containing protein [Ectobacillus antri]MDG4656738.1 YtxH domain-containing protein [Ectobacillus antri]MDG5753899.1 YtxH domain-containing protein [Ectobacillus antri]